jgi:hypothetical protein
MDVQGFDLALAVGGSSPAAKHADRSAGTTVKINQLKPKWPTSNRVVFDLV